MRIPQHLSTHSHLHFSIADRQTNSLHARCPCNHDGDSQRADAGNCIGDDAPRSGVLFFVSLVESSTVSTITEIDPRAFSDYTGSR